MKARYSADLLRSWYEDQTFPEHLHALKRVRSDLYRPSTDLADSANGESNHHSSEQMDIDTATADSYPSRPRTALASAEAQTNAKLRAKSFAEQQAVLSLRQLSEKDENTSGDKIAELTNALIWDAPPQIQQAVQRDEINTLIQLQELIKQRMAIVAHDGPVREVNGTKLTQVTAELDDEMDEIA